MSILETFSRFDAHLGASGGFWGGCWVVLGWCWVLCPGSWVLAQLKLIQTSRKMNNLIELIRFESLDSFVMHVVCYGLHLQNSSSGYSSNKLRRLAK